MNWPVRLLNLAGLASLALGAVVLLGWYLHEPGLIQVNPAFVPMQYNTALGFTLSGIALLVLASSWSRTAAVLGLAVLLVGVLTLIEYVFGLDLHIDQLFMEHYIDLKTSHPGRMAPNTALCFSLTGLTLLITALLRKSSQTPVATAIMGSVIVGLGIVAFAGYLIGVESAFGWGQLTRMAIHTAAGFIVLGSGFIALAWGREREFYPSFRLPRWTPVVIGITGITITFAMWQALVVQERRVVNEIGPQAAHYADESLFVFGTLLTLLLASKARVAAVTNTEDRRTGRGYASYAVIALGSLLAFSLYSLLSTNFEASVRSRFDFAVQNHVEAIERGIEAYLETLYHIRSAFDASSFLDRDEFRILVDRDLRRFPGIKALEWVPLVPDQERDAFEAAARSEVSPTFFFGDNPTPEGMTPAPRRERYLPIYYVEPLQPNLPVLGFDLASRPDRLVALMKAARSNKPAVSSRLQLFQSEDGVYAISVALPHYKQAMRLNTHEEREAALKGFSVAVFEIGPLIETILDRYTNPAGLHLTFEDSEAPTDRRFMYRHLSRFQAPGTDNSEIEIAHDSLSTTATLMFADRRWKVTADAADTMLYPRWNPNNLWLSLSVILISVGLAFYLRRSAQREQENARMLAYQTALMDSIPNPIFVKNIDSVFTACNRAYEKAFGIHRENFIGKTVLELEYLPEETRQAFQKADLELIRQGGVTREELSIKWADGKDHDVMYWRTTFRLNNGDPCGMIGGLFDITERKKAEAELAHSRKLMQAVLDNSPATIYLKDLDGRYLMVNQIWSEMVGVPAERVIGATDFAILPRETAEEFVANDRRVAEACELVQAEEHLPQSDGIIHTYMSYKFPVFDENGEVFAVGGVSSDVTEIEQRERQYRTLVDTIPGTVYRCSLDKHWTMLFISNEVKNLTGYPPTDFLNNTVRTFASVIHPEDSNRVEKSIVQAVEQRDPYMIEYRIVQSGGDIRYVYERGQAEYSDEGNAECLDGTIIDITELKALQADLEKAKEEADAANQAKSAFLANMSHELRTPMNAILGYSEMLMEEAEDLGQADFIPDLKKINQAGTHLLALINDVLDLSKIEAGRMEAFAEDIDLGMFIDEVCVTAQPLLSKNNNRLKIERGEQLGRAHQDLTKLRQSLFNLLSNAAKFTHDGAVTLNVERERRDRADWLTFAVSDTGIGIPADKLDYIFKEFSQADDSTTRNYGGTGLGLAITQRFCRMLGGDLTVQSQPGAGSTFTVHLPAILPGTEPQLIPTEVTPAKADGVLEATQQAARGRTVLVIDDDPEACEIIEHFLKKDGYEVVTAVSGEEGLRLAHTVKPTAITLDVMMPDMDGWSVLRALKADPTLREVPVVMLTMIDDKTKGYSLGATDYLTKPVDRDELHKVLSRYHCPEAPCQVLLVEDDVSTREMMAHTLNKAGWEVTEAGNGREALDKIVQVQPQLILLDLMMPVMDGFDFLIEMRTHAQWRDIPVIVITAKDLSDEERRMLSGKVEQVLEKRAYSREQLLSLIRKLVTECGIPHSSNK